MKKISKVFARKMSKILSLTAAFLLTLATVLVSTDTPDLLTQGGTWMEDNTVTEPVKEQDYAYSFAVVGDPQYVTMYDSQYGTTYLKQTYKWIADNVEKHNIQYVLGMGDITHRDIQSEWSIAKTAITQLDGIVPYTLVRGNHDNRTTYLDQYFGINSTYMAQKTIVACYEEENDGANLYSTKARNTIHEYSLNGVDYLIVALDFGAQDPILEWANEQVSQYPNHNVIVTTHAYIHENGNQLNGTQGVSPSYYDPSYDEKVWNGKPYAEYAKLDPTQPFNDGDDMWNKFIKKHANISMVFCGHVITNDIVKTTMVGDHGNIVQQIVVNPQAIDDNGKDNGEAGYTDLTGMVAIFYCSEDGRTMDVRYYSTLKDQYFGEENQFSFRLNAKSWSDEAGMTFSKEKIFALQEPLSVFPKTIELSFSYEEATYNRMVLGNYVDGKGGSTELALRVYKNNQSGKESTLGFFYKEKGSSSSKAIDFTEVNYAGQGNHHYIFTFDDTYAHCYVDGVLKQSVEHKLGAISSLAVPEKTYVIGGDHRSGNGGYFSNGSIQSVAMYSDIRTPQECKLDIDYMDNMDPNALVLLDLAAAKKDGRAVTNYADSNNALTLSKVDLSDSEGMTFTKSKLYVMKNALPCFPKTIEVNFKSSNPTGNQMVVASYGVSGATTLAIRVVKTTGEVSVFYKNESNSVKFTDVIVDGAYHVYAFTFTDTHVICYVDGIEAQRVAKPAGMDLTTAPTLPFGMGGDLRSGNGGAFTAGAIKWVSMYSDVRTEAEIAEDAKGLFTADENALVMVDLADAKADVDIPNYADSTNPVYAPGKLFDTEKYQVAEQFTSIPKTIETVIQYNGSTKGWIAGNYSSGSYSSWGLMIKEDGTLRLWSCEKGKSAVDKSFTTDVRSAYYQHIAVTFDGTNAYLYINGVLTETIAYGYTEIAWSTALPMVIGGDQRSGNTQYFQGAMKSIAFYSNCRTEEQIAQSAKWGVDGTDATLLAAYDFNGNTGATVLKNERVGGAVLVALSHEAVGETYQDIADFGVHEETYLMGYQQASTTYRTVSKELWDINEKGETNPNIGIEFRMKSKESKAELRALMDAQSYTKTLWAFMNVRLGYSFIEINLSNDLTAFGIRSAHFVNSMYYYPDGNKSNVMAYEDGAEYVFRLTRTALDADIDNGIGAIIRVYIGKINPETNMPEEGWDATPVYQTLALHDRNTNSTTNCGISVQTAHINHKAEMAHTLIYSSNKYVGIKTIVDGEETLNKVERGHSFTLADLHAGTKVHVGWSKGAQTYSEADLVAVGTTLENVQTPATYKALTFEVSAEEKASLRFRQRIVDGELLPLEIALKWNISVEDKMDLASYFGGIKIGYLLTASNGKTSGDKEIVALTSNYTQSYTYSVVQSNINAAAYDMKFTCQAYVELNGVKYYTASVDMEENGTSVRTLAAAVKAELKAESTTIDGIAYENAIKNDKDETIGYHYVTQSQYDLVSAVVSGN